MNSSKSNDELVDEINAKFTDTVMPVTVFIGLEITIGFIGNILVLLIVQRYYKVSNFKYFVLSLGIIDIMCCIITMPGEMYSQTNFFRFKSQVFCKIKSFFNLFTVVAEAFCLLTIALDRYRKVCQPLGWQVKPRIAKYLCYGSFGVAFVFSFPLFFLWGTRTLHEYKGRNVTYHVCEKDAMYEFTDYPLIHLAAVAAVVCVLLFIMLIGYIFVANILLGKQTQQLVISQPVQTQSFRVPSKNRSKAALSVHATVADPSSEIDTELETDFSTNDALSSCRNSEDLVDPKTTDMPFENRVPKESNEEQQDTQSVERTDTMNPVPRQRSRVTSRVRRRTLIMFILTITFIITMIIYFVLINLIASSGDFVERLSNSGKAVFYFFCRFYFINHAMNPFVYGFLDPKFKAGMRRFRSEIMERFRRH